jgi:hypothetical protein
MREGEIMIENEMMIETIDKEMIEIKGTDKEMTECKMIEIETEIIMKEKEKGREMIKKTTDITEM